MSIHQGQLFLAREAGHECAARSLDIEGIIKDYCAEELEAFIDGYRLQSEHRAIYRDGVQVFARCLFEHGFTDAINKQHTISKAYSLEKLSVYSQGYAAGIVVMRLNDILSDLKRHAENAKKVKQVNLEIAQRVAGHLAELDKAYRGEGFYPFQISVSDDVYEPCSNEIRVTVTYRKQPEDN